MYWSLVSLYVNLKIGRPWIWSVSSHNLCPPPFYLLIELHIALCVLDINTGQRWKGAQSLPSQRSYFTAEDTELMDLGAISPGVDFTDGSFTLQHKSSLPAYAVSSATAENNRANPLFLSLNIWDKNGSRFLTLCVYCILILSIFLLVQVSAMLKLICRHLMIVVFSIKKRECFSLRRPHVKYIYTERYLQMYRSITFTHCSWLQFKEIHFNL